MYEYFPVDPDVVIALMAKESACDKWATDGVSVGLMQVTPQDWTLKEEYLWNPKWNIWQGMKMLQANIDNEVENPYHIISRALAAYNCGWTSLNRHKCIPTGGWRYAVNVLCFWLPRVRAKSPLMD
jgi:soluble lytic murein transglycosylase-like protein